MYRRLTRRFTYSNVIASMALFMALGGVGYAAATVDSSSIVNNSVRGKDIHQRTIRGGDIRTNGLGGKQIKESKLGPVPDAQALQGVGPEAFVSAGTLVRYSFTLGGGETREVAASGALKLTAHCIDNGADQNGNAGKDVARIYATTTQDGAVMNGSRQPRRRRRHGLPQRVDTRDRRGVERDRRRRRRGQGVQRRRRRPRRRLGSQRGHDHRPL